MKHHSRLICVIAALLAFCAAVPEVHSALKSGNILVVANSASGDSLRIGKLYMELRGVPSSHLVEVDVTTQETISPREYDSGIAEPVRKAIKKLEAGGGSIRCIVTTYGIPIRVTSRKPEDYSEKEVRKYREMLRAKKAERSKVKTQLKNGDAGNADLRKKVNELDTSINAIQLKINELEGQDTVAAVDSELALVMYASYKFGGWVLNSSFLFNRGRMVRERPLMVSRIDAPSPERAGDLVTAALEVEKTGLTGKLYLDARGLTGKGAYARFDRDIQITAEILRESPVEIVLDSETALFGPGEAPSAALYCGWYSLGKYVDAFTWSKGAVGYHVASAEAVTLHNKKGAHWVKSMLERGVIATLGPVAEPYLDAFPRPSLFFQLLLSGEYTLAEVFTMTSPFLSWRMMLIGDPLYNPYKNKPAYPAVGLPPPP